MNRRHTALALAAALFAATASPPAAAQEWPPKVTTIVVGFAAGGAADGAARVIARRLQENLGRTVVVENRAGAGGNLGMAEGLRAAPDGHTWIWGTDTLVTVNPHVYKQLGFKPEDALPVTMATQFSQTLVCNPALGVKTLKELIAKARTEKLSYASGGAGVPGHLSMELLLSMGGFEMAHVPYKGPAPATQDVVGNQVPCGLLAGPTVLPHIRAGKLVPLGVSGSTRSPTLPDVPTLAEAGVNGYQADFSLVMFAPRGTPAPIVERMRQAFVDALKSPDVTEKLRASDQTVVGHSTAQSAALLAADSKKWGEVARRIKLGLD